MNNSIEIINVTENTCLRHNLLGQHGQSILIKYHGNNYLFDVAEVYEGFSFNMSHILPEGMAAIKDIIISHRHLDHCGALSKLIPQLSNQRIFVTSDFGQADLRDGNSEKYRFCHLDNSGKYNVAMSESDWSTIQSYPNVQSLTDSFELEEGLWVTGPVGEKMPEQCVVIDLKEKGLMIILGCSHPTLPTMIKRAQEITGNQKIYGVMGGFHFKESTKEEFQQYIDYLKELNPQFIAPGHCTGAEAIWELKHQLGDKVHVSTTGSFGTGNSIQIEQELKFNFV